MTDYATVLLAALAREPDACLSAPALAERTRIGMPTVSKVLKILQRGGLVRSTRGLHGGYSLARPAQAISAAAKDQTHSLLRQAHSHLAGKLLPAGVHAASGPAKHGDGLNPRIHRAYSDPARRQSLVGRSNGLR